MKLSQHLTAILGFLFTLHIYAVFITVSMKLRNTSHPHLLGPHDGEASVALVLDPPPPLPQLGRPVLHRGGGAPPARAGGRGRGHHAPALGGGLRHSPAGVAYLSIISSLSYFIVNVDILEYLVNNVDTIKRNFMFMIQLGLRVPLPHKMLTR